MIPTTGELCSVSNFLATGSAAGALKERKIICESLKDDFILPKIKCCEGFYWLGEVKGLVAGRGI